MTTATAPIEADFVAVAMPVRIEPSTARMRRRGARSAVTNCTGSARRSSAVIGTAGARSGCRQATQAIQPR